MDNNEHFCVGDRVQFSGCGSCSFCVNKGFVEFGETGRVLSVDDGGGNASIVFDKYNKFRNNLAGMCEKGHGYYLCTKCISHIFEENNDEEILNISDDELSRFLK